MNKKFRSPYTYKEEKGKIFTEPSLTEPDLTLSVREIQTKFSHGSLPHIGHIGQTDGEDVSFEDYERYMEMDYDLDDMTIDKLRLIEIHKKVEETTKAKAEKRKAERLAEQKELENLRAHKKKYDEKIESQKTVSDSV